MKTFRTDGMMVAGCRIRMTFLLCTVLAAVLLAHPSWAAEPAGKVAAMAGAVTAEDAGGAVRSLAQDAPVFSGDVINTGPGAKVRIVFTDSSVIFLRPLSRLVIDEYRHTGDPQHDRSNFTLMRGGFRAVTGTIGRANTDSYRIDTPVATIGIRGTDHEGRYCTGDCYDLADIGVVPPPDGLYTGTNSGRTVVGGVEFGPGQYGHTNLDRVTRMLPEPPPILTRDPYLRNAIADQDARAAGVVPADQKAEPDQGTAADQAVSGDQGVPSGQVIPSGQGGLMVPGVSTVPGVTSDQGVVTGQAVPGDRGVPSGQVVPSEQGGLMVPGVSTVPGVTSDQGVVTGQAVPGDRGVPSGQVVPSEQGGLTVQGMPVASDEGIEIPAMPSGVRTVQCR